MRLCFCPEKNVDSLFQMAKYSSWESLADIVLCPGTWNALELIQFVEFKTRPSTTKLLQRTRKVKLSSRVVQLVLCNIFYLLYSIPTSFHLNSGMLTRLGTSCLALLNCPCAALNYRYKSLRLVWLVQWASIHFGVCWRVENRGAFANFTVKRKHPF